MKEKVKAFYSQLGAGMLQEKAGGCCGPSCGCDPGVDAPLGSSLGCGDPLQGIQLQRGERVLDLGCGGGFDVLRAAQQVGEEGFVYGLDMSPEMIQVSERNCSQAGITNVCFLQGELEEIPLADESIDVVISNCVLNLTEDKAKALKEAYRVLRRGGRLAIADVVAMGQVPREIRENSHLWSRCLAGALSVAEYEAVLSQVGLTGCRIEILRLYDQTRLEQILGPAQGDLVARLAGFWASAQISAHKA
ncbi:MAG: methyltransferase domain-containing protein [Limnochordia bacterium]|jgi:arsenite methyltransferase